MKRERPDISHTYTSPPPPPPPPSTMAPDLDDHSSRLRDAGDDELLAALGYKVRTSDMADVAQKLEQLEMAMVTGDGDGGVGFQGYEDGLLSHLAVDTVHYNPADINNWLENMLSEINPSPSAPVATGDDESSTVTAVDFPGASHIYDESDCDDLRAIPGELVFGGKQSVSDSSSATEDNKRQKTLPKQAQQIPAVVEPASRTMVLVDSQETGIRLVHTLMACAEAIQQDDVKAADALVTQISLLAAAQAGPMRKVATYFADALAHRIFYSRYYPRRPPPDSIDPAIADMLEMHFYETSPYLKFAHFTANQAILEAFAGKSRVHVIDFGMKQGMQWPALMQALALRPGGPPAFRLTGIGPPQPDNLDALQQVGWRLARLAETVGVEFEYRGYVAASLADLEPYMLDLLLEPEAVAVNSVFELHRLLARPGAAEKVLATVKALKPDIVTVVEQEADHNGAVFLDRFTEALHYYSTVFDSLEGGAGGGEEQVMAEMYVGRQIQNVVACEGVERVERHETLRRWRARMEGAGFDAVHLGSNAFKQASMLLALFAGGDGYRVEEKDGCLMLGWHTRPLIVTSAWKPQPSPPH